MKFRSCRLMAIGLCDAGWNDDDDVDDRRCCCDDLWVDMSGGSEEGEQRKRERV